VLGLREGATENATVVRELLEDLARRGLDFSYLFTVLATNRVRFCPGDAAKA
jgi:hypothetical protein